MVAILEQQNRPNFKVQVEQAWGKETFQKNCFVQIIKTFMALKVYSAKGTHYVFCSQEKAVSEETSSVECPFLKFPVSSRDYSSK